MRHTASIARSESLPPDAPSTHAQAIRSVSAPLQAVTTGTEDDVPAVYGSPLGGMRSPAARFEVGCVTIAPCKSKGFWQPNVKALKRFAVSTP